MTFARTLVAAIAVGLLPNVAFSSTIVAELNASNFGANFPATGAFVFGSLNVGTNVTIGSTLDLDLAAGNNFGGLGLNIESSGIVDFDETTATLEMDFQLGSNNQANIITVVLGDNDGPGSAEDHQFYLDLSSGSTTSVSTTSTPLSTPPGFTSTAFGQLPGDGIVNFGLRQIGFQTEFDFGAGTGPALDIQITAIRIVVPTAVPEPGSAALIAFALSTGCLLTRRSFSSIKNC